jgi:hypothetical protein
MRKTNWKKSSLLQQFNLTAKDVAGFLRDPRVARTLLPDAARWYLEFAEGNVTKGKLAERLNISETGLQVLLTLLERSAVLEALYWRLLAVEISPSGKPKPLKKSS